MEGATASSTSLSNNSPLALGRLRNNVDAAWWRDPGLRRLNLWIGWLCLTQIALGYDGSLLNGLQTLPAWQAAMDYPKGITLGLVSAAYSFGGVPGGVPASWLADRYGRRQMIALSSVIVIIGAAITAASQSRNMFVAGRVVIGVGSLVGATVAPVLVAELAHPRHRGVATTVYPLTYSVGSVIAAWLCFGTLFLHHSSWSWRLPCLFQGVPALVQLPLLAFVPESPRWLVKKGRTDEARRTLAKYHANGDEEDELARFELEEIVNALAFESQNRLQASSFAFFSTPGNRRRLLIICSVGFFAQWNGVGVVAYFLSPVLASIGVRSSVQQGAINGSMSIWSFACTLAATLSVDTVGRRKLWLGSTVGMLICYIVITACSATYAQRGNTTAGGAVVAFLFLYYAAYSAAWAPLQVTYPVELMQYSLRTQGMAIVWTTTVLALIFNQLVNPTAFAAVTWKYYFVYIGILIVLLAVVWLYYPETRGRSLEEIAEIFDGQSPRPDVENHEKTPVSASPGRGRDYVEV